MAHAIEAIRPAISNSEPSHRSPEPFLPKCGQNCCDAAPRNGDPWRTEKCPSAGSYQCATILGQIDTARPQAAAAMADQSARACALSCSARRQYQPDALLGQAVLAT